MEESAQATIARLRAGVAHGRTTALSARDVQLKALEELLTREEHRLVEALAADLGKPPTEALLSDVLSSKNEVAAQRKGMRRWARTRRARLPLVLLPARAKLRHEPLGVVLVIAPWNYPVNLVVAPLAAALAVGNAVVVKPSEDAPVTAELLAELFAKYLDPEVVAVRTGGANVTEALLDSGVDHVFFTGSPQVGRAVMARAAATLTPVTLELGGKSPAYVDASVDLETAAWRLAWGKFMNAGQTCLAPDYVLVHSEIADALVDKLVSCVHAFYGDDPKASPDYGRIVNDRHFLRLEALLSGSGGRVACGGELDRAERYVAPTVLRDVAPDSALMHEEIFGPLLPIVVVEDQRAATAAIARLPTPLCAYVFANSATIRDFVAHTRSGSVCANTTLEHFAARTLPFGGLGESGTGRYHGRFGFETFSHLRPVLTKSTWPHLKIAYPPYAKRTTGLLRRLL